jgi:hypothetical protein
MNESEAHAEKSQPGKGSTIKHLVVALIRLQALWMFFYAAYGVTYLPTYFRNYHHAVLYSPSYAEAKFSLMMELLRILMHIAAGILIVQYTVPLLNFLLKDSDDEVKTFEQLSSEKSESSKSESKSL